MYRLAASEMIFDGVSNLYLISIATAFLAVIIALYCSNFLKDESEKQLKVALGGMADDEHELEDAADDDDDEEQEEDEDYLVNNSSTASEAENLYNMQQEVQRRFMHMDEDYDCNSDNEQNELLRAAYMSRDSDDDFSDGGAHADGLVGKMKSQRVKELEAQLTRDQLEEERRIEREQLAAIFELLKKQEAELNMKEIDENELNAQLSLYR